MESDEEDDDMEEDGGPPQGCDVQIYESVIDLRERRLDMEDALAEIQKAVEELKKTHKKLLDDERNIDKVQKQTDQEIQQFQTDKQRKLNQVQIVFALRISLPSSAMGLTLVRLYVSRGMQTSFTLTSLSCTAVVVSAPSPLQTTLATQVTVGRNMYRRVFGIQSENIYVRLRLEILPPPRVPRRSVRLRSGRQYKSAQPGCGVRR